MHLEILEIFFVLGGLLHGTNGSQCGQRKVKLPEGVQFIVRGSYATHGFWPWQVDLRIVTKRSWTGSKWYSTCGAAILNNQWLLTAAHCVAQKGTSENDITVRMGSNSKSNENEQGEIKMGVKRRIIHPGYVDGAQPIIDDIALLQLERPITFNKYVQPICLPTKVAKEGQHCTATGWGRHQGGDSRETPDQLKKASYTIKYGDYENWKICNSYQKSVLCAGSDSSICQGDSGGPLACPVDGRFVLYGVVSWVTKGCNQFHYPSGFANVYYFLPWIKKYIGSTTTTTTPPTTTTTASPKSTTTVAPPPKTTATTTTTVNPASTCFNKHTSCNKWAIKGYCNWFYKSYMRENCRLACGFCKGVCNTITRCRSTWINKCYFSKSRCRCVCTFGK